MNPELLLAIKRKNLISGMLFFRNMSEEASSRKADADDRIKFMVFGILAVPRHVHIESEKQVVVGGCKSFDGMDMFFDIEHPITPPEKTIGNSPSGILCSGIWRV